MHILCCKLCNFFCLYFLSIIMITNSVTKESIQISVHQARGIYESTIIIGNN